MYDFGVHPAMAWWSARLSGSTPRVAGLLAGICVVCVTSYAQSLVPRAYVITSTGSNAVTLTYSYSTGNLLFDNVLPVTDAGAQISAPFLSYYHSFGLFGRSANIAASLPYGVGNFSGKLEGTSRSLYRSGLSNSIYRFSVNLIGGPALPVEQFRAWRQKTVVDASVMVLAPTGQYDPARLINPGSNRWAVKPEIGWSRRRNRLVLDAYGAVWLFTANAHYYPGRAAQTELAVGAVETHLSYDVKPRLWFSVDGNFWYGGATSLNGLLNTDTRQENSRAGVTASVPLNRHESLKFSYSRGLYTKFGGDYQTISAAWQYSWVRQPK